MIGDHLLPLRNRLLAALSQEDRDRVVAAGELVDLGAQQVLQQADGPITQLYFPLDAVVALVGAPDGAPPVEVATVGNEGLLGLGVFLHDDRALFGALCLVPGRALRVPATTVDADTRPLAALDRVARRYAHTLIAQAAYTAACNCSHRAEQRMARWLLLAHDRVRRNEFPVTHAFAGGMLGVRRPTATLTLGRLRRAGVIDHWWGRVAVRDRTRLEQIACPCYARIRALFDRMTA
jgi:CRP-like cAMP-binding protein